MITIRLLLCTLFLASPAWAVLDNTGIIPLQTDATATGDGAPISVEGYSTVGVELTLTDATITWKGSVFGTYVAIPCTNKTTGTSATTATTTGSYVCDVAGLGTFLAPITTYGSGTVTATARATTATTSGSGGDASATNQTTMIGHVDGLEDGIGASADVVGTSGAVGTLNSKIRLMTAQLNNIQVASQLMDDDQVGASTNYLTSAGVTEDETQIKATAGRLLGFQITNTNAAVRYFRCANLTAASTTPGTSPVFYGTAVPGATNGDGLVVNLGPTGIAFSVALTCWLTTGAADTDVAEVAANELKWNVYYK